MEASNLFWNEMQIYINQLKYSIVKLVYEFNNCIKDGVTTASSIIRCHF